MLKYQIYQSKLAGTSAYGKFYARIVTDQSIDLASLVAVTTATATAHISR